MFWTSVKRIVRSGFTNFWRNGFVSVSSVFVMIITLSVIAGTIFLGAILNSSLQEIRDKVDVNVYFFQSASESDILALQQNLNALPQVATTTYISADTALANFRARHADDQTTLSALDEVGTNPLEASITVKAKDPSQYQSISNFLQSSSALSASGNTIVDTVNYSDNKAAIDTLTGLINSANKLGLALTIFLIAISILITYNTIRLAIFMDKDEISVMRLVGASQSYIRGPFVVSGAMYGLFSAIITLIVLWPVTLWLGRITANFFIDLNIFNYYLSNFFEIAGILIVAGVLVGAFSSWLAARKHLHV